MVVRTTTTQTKTLQTKETKENTETNKQTNKQTNLLLKKTFNADFCENSHRKDDHS